jgi:1,4-alpha-glucan branching enzyme
MYMPDMWIKLLKETPDEQWSMGHIAHSLTNRRWKEKVIGYCESHDQAIVGDKTMSMWLFKDQIYTGMKKSEDEPLNF